MNNFPKVNVNFILNHGGLGDHIATLPVFKYFETQYPWMTPYVYVPDYFLPLIRNMLPNTISRPFSKQKKMFNDDFFARQTQIMQHDTLSTHLTDYAFHTLGNKQVEAKHKNYLKLNLDWIKIDKFNLPEKYVVITTGFTAKIREFLPEKVNAIVRYLNEKNMPVVFLGQKQTYAGINDFVIIGKFNEEIDYSKGINLVDKTSLLEAGKIIAQSKAIVGIDNGLLHLAGCSDVAIIGGYTSVNPILRNPYRNDILGWNCYNIIPPEDCPERFFQSETDFVFNFDMRNSYNGNNDTPKSLKIEDFIAALEKVL